VACMRFRRGEGVAVCVPSRKAVEARAAPLSVLETFSRLMLIGKYSLERDYVGIKDLSGPGGLSF
jgi:hypothetical protein